MAKTPQCDATCECISYNLNDINRNSPTQSKQSMIGSNNSNVPLWWVKPGMCSVLSPLQWIRYQWCANSVDPTRLPLLSCAALCCRLKDVSHENSHDSHIKDGWDPEVLASPVK
jgi:hypothetical protein